MRSSSNVPDCCKLKLKDILRFNLLVEALNSNAKPAISGGFWTLSAWGLSAHSALVMICFAS